MKGDYNFLKRVRRLKQVLTATNKISVLTFIGKTLPISLHTLLNKQERIQNVGVVEQKDKIMRYLQERDVEILLTTLSPLIQLTDIQKLTEQYPGLKVIVLADRQDLMARENEDAFIAEMLNSGVSSYHFLSESPYKLVEKIDAVHRYNSYIDHQHVGVLMKTLREKQKKEISYPIHSFNINRDIGSKLLSERECDVLECLVEGYSTDDIAGHLFLTPYTVKNHVNNIIQKLQANNRTHAIIKAIKKGIAEPVSSYKDFTNLV